MDHFMKKKTIEICGKIADLAIFFVKLEKSVYKIVDTQIVFMKLKKSEKNG